MKRIGYLLTPARRNHNSSCKQLSPGMIFCVFAGQGLSRSAIVDTRSSGQGKVSPALNRGPCSVCKQYFPQLKLGPFPRHCHHCKGDISQRPGAHHRQGIPTSPSIKKRPYPFFSKACEQTGNLIAQLLTHTDEKPCACRQCDK